MTSLVFDLETAPPLGEHPVCPESWAAPPDNYRKPEAIARYRAEREANWPTEWRRRASLDWRVGRIVCAGIGDGVEAYVYHAFNPADEASLLRTTWEALAAARPLAGYGIRTFDIPWIVGRSLVLGVTPSRILSNIARWKTEVLVDCQDLLSDRPLAGWTLAAYAALLALPSQPVGAGADVAEWVAAGDTERVLAHCEQDIWTTWHLYQRCRVAYGV